MPELRRCRGTWAYCDGDCSRCTTTATTQTSMVYLTQPTVDAVERKKGKWIFYERREPQFDLVGTKTWANAYRCSECGFIHTVIEDFGHYLYCPNCGKYMGEETEDVH